MIKRLGWIGGTVLLLFIMVAFAGAAQETMGKPPETTGKLETLDHYPNFQRKTNTEKTATYYYSISTILTKSEAVNQSIQKWIEKEKGRFLTFVEKNQRHHEEQPAKLHISVELQSETDEIYSLVYTIKSNEPNRRSYIKIYNLGPNDNKILHLTDVLTVDDSHIDELSELVEAYAGIENESSLTDWLEDLDKKPNQINWQINKNQLTLYFTKHHKVEIPVERLIPYLSKSILNRLQIAPETQVEKILHPNGKYIALTFDDGPSPTVTPRILETLKQHEAKATFFMLGSRVQYYPELAKQVAAAGHEIGNHTESHPNLSRLNEEQIRNEILETIQIIEEIIGISPDYFRPPYGVYNDIVEKVALEYSSPIVLWSVDSLDWKYRNVDGVNQLVQDTVSPGSIVLLHDIHSSTADALPILMTELKNEGYQFVTISELLSLQESNGIGPYYGVAY